MKAGCIRDIDGNIVSEPSIGTEVAINSMEGTLIASSLFGITALDVFDEVITSHNDLNNFLIDNGQPKSTTYPGCAIRCFILLCSLLGCSIEETAALGSFAKFIKEIRFLRVTDKVTLCESKILFCYFRLK